MGTGLTLPTFFVIGAPKCGTTSLHRYLDEHPAISMSRVKEPWVFAREDYRERLGRYRELFAEGAAQRGESSAVYSLWPHFDGVPERIATVVAEPRFIYLVREPVERAIAHHAQLVTDGKESRPLEAALLADEAENVYLAGSRYATQLRRYLRLFPRESLLVVEQSELAERAEHTMARIFAFLGVDPGFRSDAFRARLNTRAEHRIATPLGAALGDSPAVRLGRRLPLPSQVRAPLRRLFSRRLERQPASDAVRERFAAQLRDEVDWLREFTGLALEGWVP